METFVIANKRFLDHIVESAEGSVTTQSLWGFFFLFIVNRLAVFGTTCSVTLCVSLLSFSYQNFKPSERSRNDLDRVKTKRASEHLKQKERGRERPQMLSSSSLPPPPFCSAPPGSRCPEGGSRRTNPTHHLSPEQPGGTSFTLQSLPVYTTPLQRTHSCTHSCEDSASTSVWFHFDHIEPDVLFYIRTVQFHMLKRNLVSFLILAWNWFCLLLLKLLYNLVTSQSLYTELDFFFCTD